MVVVDDTKLTHVLLEKKHNWVMIFIHVLRAVLCHVVIHLLIYNLQTGR